MTTRELIEAKAKELMDCYWGESFEDGLITTTPYAIRLSKHVLASEIRARIEEVELQRPARIGTTLFIEFSKYQINQINKRVNKLQQQLKEIEGG